MSHLTYSLLVQKLGKGETGYHGKEEEKVIDAEGDAGNFSLKSRKDFPAMVGGTNCPQQNEQCGRPGGLGNRAHSYPVETVCPIPASPMPLGRTAHLGVIALAGRVLQLSKMRSLPLSGKSLSNLNPEVTSLPRRSDKTLGGAVQIRSLPPMSVQMSNVSSKMEDSQHSSPDSVQNHCPSLTQEVDKKQARIQIKEMF